MEIPVLPKRYFFKIEPGYIDYAFMDVEHYNACVKLFRKGFFKPIWIATVSIPGTNERIHPTQEQVEEAMKTAVFYVTQN